MNKIICTHCGEEVELSEALTKDIEKTVLATELEKHKTEIAKIKKEADEEVLRQVEEAKEKATKQAGSRLEAKIKELQGESAEDKKDNQELRERLKELMQQLRDSDNARKDTELEMQKRLMEEGSKIREQAEKSADEKQKLKLLEKDKQLEAARKANEELQRKLNQGSQQMQGEVLELDLEDILSTEFRDDDVSPVEKGVKGADIKQVIKSPRGIVCGVMLWEVKRTKAWTESWVQKLKDDLRATKANIPIIITEVLPKNAKGDIFFHNGVWVAKPSSALVLGSLLRKGLLDVGREKAISKHRDTSADSLYSFVTSHEFVHQIEAMVEVYTEMITDIAKEKASLERVWAKREGQANKLLGSTASIIGGMQAQIGQSSMPRIKGLDLLESGEE